MVGANLAARLPSTTVLRKHVPSDKVSFIDHDPMK